MRKHVSEIQDVKPVLGGAARPGAGRYIQKENLSQHDFQGPGSLWKHGELFVTYLKYMRCKLAQAGLSTLKNTGIWSPLFPGSGPETGSRFSLNLLELCAQPGGNLATSRCVFLHEERSIPLRITVQHFLLIIALTITALMARSAGAQCHGTPGTKGIPRLVIDKPTPGTTMDMDIYRGKPGGFFIFVLTVGSGSYPTPIGTICLNLALPFFFHVGTLDANGEATISLPIPNLPTILNFQFSGQAAILDSANKTGYALSNSVGGVVTPPYGFVAGWNRNTGGHVMRIDMSNGNVLDTVKVGGRPIPCTVMGKSGRYLFAADDMYSNVYLVDYGVTPPSVQFIKCTSAKKAISMATMFSASLSPSPAPRQAASRRLASCLGTSTVTFPLVGESSVSGTIILAITNAAGAEISEATARWPARVAAVAASGAMPT